MKFFVYIALLLFSSLSSCAMLMPDFKTPEVSLVSIKPLRFSLIEQVFELRIKVKNPNAMALPIDGMQYHLELNHTQFADGVSHNKVTVPANGEGLFDIQVNSRLNALLQQLQHKIPAAMDYKLSGEIGVLSKAMSIPFTYEGKIDINNLLRR